MQRLHPHVCDATDAKGCADAAGAPCLGDGHVHANEHLARFVGEGRAGLGWRDPAAPTVEEFNAQLGLQLSYRLRKRRLRDVEALRRTPEVALLGDGEEVPQQAKLDSLDV
jgi:hypothetical protein